jgi:hypothetical protein
MRAAMSVARSASSLICRVFHNEVMQTVAAVSSSAIGDLFTDMPRAFDFDDVSLMPRVHSTLAHRTEALPVVGIGPLRLTIPLIGSPMPDVCGVDMCRALGEDGALGILLASSPSTSRRQSLVRSPPPADPSQRRSA